MNPEPNTTPAGTHPVEAYDPPTVTHLGPAADAEATHDVLHFS